MEDGNEKKERQAPDGSDPTQKEKNKNDIQVSTEQGSPPKEVKNRNRKTKVAKEGEKNVVVGSTENDELTRPAKGKDNKTKANIELKKTQDDMGQVDNDTNGDSLKISENTQEGPGLQKEAADEFDISEDDDLLQVEKPDLEARNKLFNKGMKLYHNHKRSRALKYFLMCITGVLESGEFQFFPQCLKKIAEIYYSQENYEKAIQFIQAEKLFYETALLNRSGLKDKPEGGQKEKDEGGCEAEAGIQSDAKPEEMRAEEYENLAKMCLENKQPELALEYQGKATQIRQQFLGNDHPLTKKSLDFFTVVYAEVGKQEYSDTLKKTLVQSPGGSTGSESGILRKRKNTGKKEDGNRHVRFQEPEREEEGTFWRSVLLVVFIMCVLVLVALLGYLYCRLDATSQTCATWKSQLHYYYMKVKYFYYTWNPDPQYKFG